MKGRGILATGDVVKARRVATVLLLALLIGLVGCFLFDTEPVLNVVISPAQGIVPYSAQIVATAPPGTFTFELPSSTVEQNEGSLEVLVDSLNWTATVTWTDGEATKSAVVTAYGTNARPIINLPRIDGIPNQWYLEPRERTLIDFSFRPASLSGPRTGVDYDGDWIIKEISVTCSEKLLCNQRVRDSIYCPPYETGVFHANFNGILYESACIVYPTSTYEPDSKGVPYAPAPEDGYSYDTIQNRSLFKQVAFPAQTAIIRIVVQDNFGRLTGAEFEIPVLEFGYGTATGSGNPQSFSEAAYFVASKDETIFHQSWCYRACLIPEASRIYFAENRHAEESGRTLDPYCSVGQAGPCACTGVDLDCEDFASQVEAQTCFEYCRSMEYGDIHGLDEDGDGKACESPP